MAGITEQMDIAKIFKECGVYVWNKAIAPIFLRFFHKPLLRLFPTDHDLKIYNNFKEKGREVFEYFEKVDMGQAHSRKIISSYKEFHNFLNSHDFYFMNGKMDKAHINLKQNCTLLCELIMKSLFLLGESDFLKVYPDDFVNPEIRSRAILDLNKAVDKFIDSYVELTKQADLLFAKILN